MRWRWRVVSAGLCTRCVAARAHVHALQSWPNAPGKGNGKALIVRPKLPVPMQTVNQDGVNCRTASRFRGSDARKP